MIRNSSILKTYCKKLTVFVIGTLSDPFQVFLDPHVNSRSIVARTTNTSAHDTQKNWKKGHQIFFVVRAIQIIRDTLGGPGGG